MSEEQKKKDNVENKENISMQITAKQQISKEDQKKFEKEVQKRVEEKYKEKKDKILNNENNKIQLTLENLLNIKAILEAAVQRNAFKQEEMKDVLGNYEFFVKGLQTLIESQKT